MLGMMVNKYLERFLKYETGFGMFWDVVGELDLES